MAGRCCPSGPMVAWVRGPSHSGPIYVPTAEVCQAKKAVIWHKEEQLRLARLQVQASLGVQEELRALCCFLSWCLGQPMLLKPAPCAALAPHG